MLTTLKIFQLIRKEVMKLSAKMTEEQDDQQIVSEWRFAAMVNFELVFNAVY